MKILNLTQHETTPAQGEAGVVEPRDKAAVKAALSFDDLPPAGEVMARAIRLTRIALEEKASAAMIGGAPFLMFPLHTALVAAGNTPLYAFSLRESVESMNEKGEVVKTSLFVHKGLVDLTP